MSRYLHHPSHEDHFVREAVEIQANYLLREREHACLAQGFLNMWIPIVLSWERNGGEQKGVLGEDITLTISRFNHHMRWLQAHMRRMEEIQANYLLRIGKLYLI